MFSRVKRTRSNETHKIPRHDKYRMTRLNSWNYLFTRGDSLPGYYSSLIHGPIRPPRQYRKTGNDVVGLRGFTEEISQNSLKLKQT